MEAFLVMPLGFFQHPFNTSFLINPLNCFMRYVFMYGSQTLLLPVLAEAEPGSRGHAELPFGTTSSDTPST